MNEVAEKKMRELYEQYKKSRDSELDKFWKNSMYVWTFLGLCFTAYGVLIVKYVDYEGTNFKVQLAIAAICTFGFLLSWVWKSMAQGLKAWYEVFEYAVWDLESYNNVFEYPSNFTIGNYWTVDESKTSKPYSPSALVVSIGWCMIWFWVAAFVINFFLYFVDDYSNNLIMIIQDSVVSIKKVSSGLGQSINEPLKCIDDVLKKIEPQINKAHNVFFYIIYGLLLILGIVFGFMNSSTVRSSVLRTQMYQDKFVEIKKQLLEQKVPYLYLEVKKKKKDKDIIRIVLEKKYEQDDRIKKIVSKIQQDNQSSFNVKDEYIDNNIK